MDGYYRIGELGLSLASGPFVIPADRFEAVDGATRLLQDAEAKAKDIIAAAEQAYRDEQKRGYEDGLTEARLGAAERLLSENRALEIGLQNLEHDLSRVVMSCVRKLVDGFNDSEKAEALVRAALKQMRQEKRAELRVAPALSAHFKGMIGDLIKEFPEVELVDVVEDHTLEGSHIIVETSIGRVDGNIGQRLTDLDVIIHRAHASAAEPAHGSAADPLQAPHD